MSNYIDGAWRPFTGPQIEVENPATGEALGHVPSSTTVEVDDAVAAAARAFPKWAGVPRGRRAALLLALADALESRGDQLATTIARDVGTPIRIASRIQTALPISVLRSHAEMLGTDDPEERIGNSLVLREPVGVVAAITPWNYPLHQVVCKLAPALAAGATVVLKPSEVAPLVVKVLFEAIHEAGFPPGAVNLVHGTGAGVGAPLVTHRDVDMVSFTGSVPVGSAVAAAAAGSIKRVTLELGGKSANVILEDADLTTAVKVGVANAFLNGGQTCTAWTRMLVPSSRHDEALALAKQYAESFLPGDPLDPATKLGPMVSGRQAERVRGFIRTGLEEGAQLVTGGVESPAGLDRGHYVLPTVFGGVDPNSTVAQEEIFGPVLSVIAYRDEGEALDIANNSRYGLHGAVWSADAARASEFARHMRTGSVDINGGAYNMLAPFGGYKHSGVGRELGRYGLADFHEVKSLQL